ncbi:MAG: alpha/beta hydrolase [Pseudomonadota bacterium]
MTEESAARDWDDAFANLAHIPGGDLLPAKWARDAALFRESKRESMRLSQPYGRAERATFDFFTPDMPAKGLFIFIHGGYWMQTSPADWSHLAKGALERGFATALIGYPLAPDARVAEITRAVQAGIEAAGRQADGPIYLAGHSAGAHLALRALEARASLSAATRARLKGVLGLGGVYDLRPLLATRLNETLRLTAAEASAESPLLQPPQTEVDVLLWVGANERPEFIRQSRAMADAWQTGGARLTLREEPGAHHFTTLEGLTFPTSPLLDAFLGHSS